MRHSYLVPLSFPTRAGSIKNSEGLKAYSASRTQHENNYLLPITRPNLQPVQEGRASFCPLTQGNASRLFSALSFPTRAGLIKNFKGLKAYSANRTQHENNYLLPKTQPTLQPVQEGRANLKYGLCFFAH
jgi:hypothetical protein